MKYVLKWYFIKIRNWNNIYTFLPIYRFIVRKVIIKTSKYMNLIAKAIHWYKILKNLKITADCFEWSTRRKAPEKVFQDIFSNMGSTSLPYWLYIKIVLLFCGTYCINRMIVPRYFVFVLRVCAYSLIYLSCVSSQKSRLKMNKKVNVKN